jgi:hypothetical protein
VNGDYIGIRSSYEITSVSRAGILVALQAAVNKIYCQDIYHLLAALLLNIYRYYGAGVQPPTICAKSYKAYNVSTCYYRMKHQNGMSLAASPHAIYLPYTLLR